MLSVCPPCSMLLRVVGSCCAKFETGETFARTTPNVSFVLWSPKRSANNVGSICSALPTLLGPRTRITHNLLEHRSRVSQYCRSNSDYGIMHCGSQHYWELLMIHEINHIWTAEMKWKWRNDRRSERNLCNCVNRTELFSGFFTQLHKLRSLRRLFLHFHYWELLRPFAHLCQHYPTTPNIFQANNVGSCCVRWSIISTVRKRSWFKITNLVNG